LAIWPVDEFQYFIKKYADWAPPPYSELPNQAGPLGTMPGPSPPPLFRVEYIISGMDALMMGALDHLESTSQEIGESLRETDVERSFKLLCTKVCSLIKGE
jgi:hypothetical protein